MLPTAFVAWFDRGIGSCEINWRVFLLQRVEVLTNGVSKGYEFGIAFAHAHRGVSVRTVGRAGPGAAARVGRVADRNRCGGADESAWSRRPGMQIESFR